MRIAYVIPGCFVSGGIAVICQHANRLLNRGHDVYLITEKLDTSMSWFPDQRVPVRRLDQYPDDVDILVATAWSTSFRVANLPALRKFYFVQSDETRFHPQDTIWHHFTALSYLYDYQYITEARWIKVWLSHNFGHEACLVPNGLDSDIFYPCAPLAPKGDKPRILLEGAIGLPYKGMKEAFEAVAPLDVEVWCVSSLGKPEPHWKCDRFFEQIPMTEMKSIYSSCDVLLKLSRVEGFFGPPMEMMACGGASVVGKVTGYDEYIVDGYNAVVVDPLDIFAATEAVQYLINNKDAYDNLVENGRKTAREWSWEKSIDVLEKHYADSLENNYSQATTSAATTDANKSLSFLYYTFLGEIDSDSEAVASMVSDNNAERLCRKLKHNQIFRLLANVLATVYQFLRRNSLK